MYICGRLGRGVTCQCVSVCAFIRIRIVELESKVKGNKSNWRSAGKTDLCTYTGAIAFPYLLNIHNVVATYLELDSYKTRSLYYISLLLD